MGGAYKKRMESVKYGLDDVDEATMKPISGWRQNQRSEMQAIEQRLKKLLNSYRKYKDAFEDAEASRDQQDQQSGGAAFYSTNPHQGEYENFYKESQRFAAWMKKREQ